MDEKQMQNIVQSLTGITFKEWKMIEQQVNNEFKRLANKNTIVDADKVVKNLSLEVFGR